MEWRHSGSLRPQKNPSAKLRWKSYRLDFFWDQDSILLIDYLPKGQTINTEYYSSLLVQLKDILKEKRRGKVTKGGLVLARQCPGSPGTCNPKKLAYLGFQCLGSPTLFSGSGPVGLLLFPGLKKTIEDRHFSSEAEVIAAAETWLDGQPSEFFLNGLQKLEQWAKKCTELREQYVE